MAMPESRYYLQTLERGLAVIEALGKYGPDLTVSEVASKSGVSRTAVRRVLLTLVDLEYVSTDGRVFNLTPRILELGTPILDQLSLPRIAYPHLQRLAVRTGEGISLAILDHDEALTIAQIPTSRIMTVISRVGSRLPAYCTSTGRTLLSGLPDTELDAYLERTKLESLTQRTLTSATEIRDRVRQVRQDGYALVDQEVEEGLRSLSAPVHDRTGKVVAACNLSLHPSRAQMAHIRKELLPFLLAAAADIERDLKATQAAG